MMTQLNRTVTATASASQQLQRYPQRITITLNWALYQRLLYRSDYEGRSLSNLSAHLLELACPAEK